MMLSLEELDEQLRSGKKMHYLINYRIIPGNLYEGFQEELQGKVHYFGRDPGRALLCRKNLKF